MIKIGVMDIDVSHPLAFAGYLKNGNCARYTHIFNGGFRGDDEVDGFIKNFGLQKRCDSVAELALCVDVGFIQGCNWDKHLDYAKEFIKAGKPVFIDKPIVGNLAECKKLEKLVDDGAVIIGGSSARYAYEIVDFAKKTEEEVGKIMHVFGTAGVDEFNYAIHIVEAFGGLIGTGAVATKFLGASIYDGKTCETYQIRFNEGLYATYCTFQKCWQPFEIVITTTTSTHHVRIDSNKLYEALLDRICDFLETGKSCLAEMRDITESVKIMLAGRISRDEKNGQEVLLSDIPENDSGFDGYKFEKEYAATASKIYL